MINRNIFNIHNHFFLLILCLLGILPAYSQEKTIQKAADKLVPEIEKLLKQTAEDSKISICFFMGTDAKSDSIKSRLGADISEKIYYSLLTALNKTSREALCPACSYSKLVDSVSLDMWVPPDTRDEEVVYMKKYNMKNTPDYYLIGRYSFSADYKNLIIYNVALHRYGFKLDAKDLGLNPIEVPVEHEEISNLKFKNQPYSSLSDPKQDMINFEGKADLFDFSILEYPSGKIVADNNPLYIDNLYEIEIVLKEPAYLYIFYNTIEDKDRPYFDLIYPDPTIDLKKLDLKLLPAGKSRFPSSHLLQPAMPEGKAIIKIIASLKQLPIEYQIVSENEFCFRYENCRDFMKIINAYPDNMFDAKSITKEVIIKL